MLLQLAAGVLCYVLAAHVVDYKILKNRYLKSRKWGLNMCCGYTDGGGVNADIVQRKVPNFMLVEDIYHLPFKDKQFDSVFCSHVMEHVDSPELFYKELHRIAKDVVILVPPVWDVAGILTPEHKWQFLCISSKQEKLPPRIKLPYFWLHERFGQIIT